MNVANSVSGFLFFAVIDLEGHCTFANRHLLDLFRNKTVVGTQFVTLLKEEEQPAWEKAYDDLQQFPFQTVQISTEISGEVYSPVVQWQIVPQLVNNQIVGYECCGGLLEVEESIKEEEYKDIIEHTAQPLFLTTLEGRILFGNKASKDLFGYSATELKGMNLQQVVGTEDPRLETALLEKAKTGWVTCELTAIKKTGERFPCQFTSASFKTSNGEVNCSTSIVDITDQHNHEKELERLITETQNVQKKAEEESYRLTKILESISDGFVSLDPDENIVYINKKAEGFLGKEQEELVGQQAGSHLRPTIQRALHQMDDKNLSIYKPVVIEEFLEQGNIWIENRIYPSTRGVSIFIKDITNQKQFESLLQKQQADLKAVIENTSDLVFSVDTNLNLILFNSSFRALTFKLTKIRPKKGANLFSTYPKDKIEGLREYTRKAVLGERLSFEESFIIDGSPVFLDVKINPVLNGGVVSSIVVVARDITEKKKQEEALLLHEAKLKVMVDDYEKIMASSLDVICTMDADGRIINVSAAARDVFGYEPTELQGRIVTEMVYEEDRERTIEAAEQIKAGEAMRDFENRYYKKDGSLTYVLWSSKWDEKEEKFYAIARDASEKKATEMVLKASEEKYKLLFYENPFPMWIYDIETEYFLEVNKAAIADYGYSKEEFLSMTIGDIRTTDERYKLGQYHLTEEAMLKTYKGYWKHTKKNGETIHVEINAHPLEFEGRKCKLVIANNRTEQTIAEQQLLKSNERFNYVIKATFNAIWDWDLVENKTEWNEGLRHMFGFESGEIFDNMKWWEDNLHPDDKERVVTNLTNTIEQKRPYWKDEYRFRTSDGNYKYVLDRGFTLFENGEAVRMIGAMQDVSERKENELMLKELNIVLEKRAKELSTSNAELERFAYVASHDLQEPLRMVTSFLQLLEKRYKDKLDKKAHEYISFAVDGANRMKKLILDLLEYSRVNTSTEENEQVDVKVLMEEVTRTYKSALKENKGKLHFGNMPVVVGNQTQLLQLFQNLVGNAIKYRSDAPLEIKIDCTEKENQFQFSVADNGIGIEPRFFHKIFIIFQRLHNRDQYSGTGIGLAICKKIAERHGGQIWVESTPGSGSTFYFTIPK